MDTRFRFEVKHEGLWISGKLGKSTACMAFASRRVRQFYELFKELTRSSLVASRYSQDIAVKANVKLEPFGQPNVADGATNVSVSERSFSALNRPLYRLERYKRMLGEWEMTLDKFTLHKDRESDKWRLEKEGSDRARRTYETKDEALQNLRGDVGKGGGSVRIRKLDNTIQEERTYPRAKDPPKSKG